MHAHLLEVVLKEAVSGLACCGLAVSVCVASIDTSENVGRRRTAICRRAHTDEACDADVKWDGGDAVRSARAMDTTERCGVHAMRFELS